MYEYKIKEVVKIVDGDTIDILIELGFGLTKKERVRLAGIDTPESRTTNLEEKEMGLQAKDALTGMLESAEEIKVKTEKDGKFGRMLGWLWADNDMTSLNHQLVNDGYAWAYDGGSKEKDLQELRDKRN